MPFLLSKQDLEEKGEQIEKYRSELFMRKYMPKVRSFPRVRELFERIRADRKKIALASSSDKKQLTILKKIAQVEDVVDCETSADDIDSSKPDPDVFHAALKCLRQPEPAPQPDKTTLPVQPAPAPQPDKTLPLPLIGWTVMTGPFQRRRNTQSVWAARKTVWERSSSQSQRD